MTVIQKRIDAFGVSQPEILKLGDDGILVRLPGFTDLSAAEKLVEKTGFLEFREVEKDSSGALVYLSNYISGNFTNFLDTKETGNRIFVGDEDTSGTAHLIAFLSKDASGLHLTDVNGNPVSTANLTKYSKSASWIVARGDSGTALTGALLADAQPTLSNATTGSQAQVTIKWNSTGSVIFDEIAKRLYNPTETYSLDHVLGIFLDNSLISAPQNPCPIVRRHRGYQWTFHHEIRNGTG